MNRQPAALQSGVAVAVRGNVGARFDGALPPSHALPRAGRNIDDLLQDLQARFHRLRQSGIDEVLFDVIAGFDALIPRSSGHR